MKRRSKRFWVMGWIALAIVGLIASPATAGKKNDTLIFASERELENNDNYFNTAREGIIIARHIWDTLIYRDPETFEYKPLLATSWKWVNDVTIEAELRKGVKFHNGEKFDADDVVYTLNWVSDPKNGVKNQTNVKWIKNAEKLGEYKVRIHLKKPFPPALEFLAGPICIYPNEYYAKVGPDGMHKEPIGTGPYKVTKVIQGKEIRFVANKDYFDGPKGKPSIGKLVFKTIPDKSSQMAELMAGGLDWIWRVPKDRAKNLKSVPGLEAVAGETMRVGYLSFDATGRAGKGPMQDLKVRKAIAHAIDRQSIVDNLVGEGSRVVHAACFPTQIGCTDDVAKYEYNTEKAKKLLAEAGYPNGFSIDIYAYRERPYTEAVIGYLREVGIKAKLNFLKYAALRDKNRSGGTAFHHMTWGSYSINDVSAITSYFFTFSSDDMSRDTDVKNWLEAGDTSIDANVRKINYSKALKRISEQVYWLPMFTLAINYAYTKDLDFTPRKDEIPRFFTSKWK